MYLHGDCQPNVSNCFTAVNIRSLILQQLQKNMLSFGAYLGLSLKRKTTVFGLYFCYRRARFDVFHLPFVVSEFFFHSAVPFLQ